MKNCFQQRPSKFLLLTTRHRRQSGVSLRLCQPGGRLSAVSVFSLSPSLTGLLSSTASGAIRRNVDPAADLFSCAGAAGAARQRRFPAGVRGMPAYAPGFIASFGNNYRDTLRWFLHSPRHGFAVSPSPPSPSRRAGCRPDPLRIAIGNLSRAISIRSSSRANCTPAHEASAAKLQIAGL